MGSNERRHRVVLEESIKNGALMLKWESPACFEGMRPPPAPLLRVGDCPWRAGEGCPGSERARQSPAIEGAALPAVASLQTALRANGKTNSPCCLPACPPLSTGRLPSLESAAVPGPPKAQSQSSPCHVPPRRWGCKRQERGLRLQQPVQRGQTYIS